MFYLTGTKLLCDHLIDVSYKWEHFGLEIDFSMDELDKIRHNITGLNDIVDYCYLTVLEKWLTGEKDNLTKELLVETLKSEDNLLLAESISNDSCFDLTMRYLCKKLRPLKYCYKDYGLRLGLDLPDYTHLEKIVHDSSGLYMTMVIMLWFEKTGEDGPSKILLSNALQKIDEPELAAKLDKEFEGTELKCGV